MLKYDHDYGSSFSKWMTLTYTKSSTVFGVLVFVNRINRLFERKKKSFAAANCY